MCSMERMGWEREVIIIFWVQCVQRRQEDEEQNMLGNGWQIEKRKLEKDELEMEIYCCALLCCVPFTIYEKSKIFLLFPKNTGEWNITSWEKGNRTKNHQSVDEHTLLWKLPFSWAYFIYDIISLSPIYIQQN